MNTTERLDKDTLRSAMQCGGRAYTGCMVWLLGDTGTVYGSCGDGCCDEESPNFDAWWEAWVKPNLSIVAVEACRQREGK